MLWRRLRHGGGPLHKIIPLELFETRRLLGALVGLIALP